MGGKFMIAFSSDKRAATGLKGGDNLILDIQECAIADAAPQNQV